MHSLILHMYVDALLRIPAPALSLKFTRSPHIHAYIAAPFLAGVFAVANSLEGGNYDSLKQRLDRDYLETFKIDCYVWPLFSVLNFRFCPLAYQPLTVNLFACGWNGEKTSHVRVHAQHIHTYIQQHT